MPDSWDDPDHHIRNCFWILPIFKKIHNIQSFKDFLISNNIEQNEMIFSGFKLLIKQIFAGYFLDLERESFLGLTEDHQTRRAFFYGVDYNKFTSKSEKANILRNLQALFHNLEGIKDYDSLHIRMDVMNEKFFVPLEKIFADSVNVDVGITVDKLELLKLFGLSQLLNPVMDNIKYDDDSTDLQTSEIQRKREQRFTGYKAGLAFILMDSVGDELSSVMSANLESLPGIISSTEYKIVDQIRQRTGREFAFGKFFIQKKKPCKKEFGEIIEKSPLPQLSLNERLDQLLLWYRFEVIGSGPSKIFSGGSTFRSLLRGEIQERIENGIKENLLIIRFKHTGKPPFFSYAVLLERFGSFSDYSGWMIFTRVGGDYHGFGGFEYATTEQLLNRNSENVDVNEFEIDEEALKSYIEKRDPTESVEMKQRIDVLGDRLNDAVGRLVEFVTKSFYEEQGYETKIYFNDPDVLNNRKEIDVLAIDHQNNKVVLAECSTNIGIEINAFIKEINDKVDLLKSSPKFKEFGSIEKVFVTSSRSIAGLLSGPEIVKRLNEAGIKVLEIEFIIKSLPKKFRRETLLQLFKSRKQEDYFFDL